MLTGCGAAPIPLGHARQTAAAELLTLRGGSTDIDHMKVRLESYGPYAVVGALLMNAALRICSSTPDIKGLNWKPSWAPRLCRAALIALCATAVLSGLYCTVVMTMIGMYSKSALGLGLVEECMEFLRVTWVFRKRAHDAFLCSLASFTGGFAIERALKVREGETPERMALLLPLAVLACTITSDCSKLLELSAELIYKPRKAAGLL